MFVLWLYLPLQQATLLFTGEGWSPKRGDARQMDRTEAERLLPDVRSGNPGCVAGMWGMEKKTT